MCDILILPKKVISRTHKGVGDEQMKFRKRERGNNSEIRPRLSREQKREIMNSPSLARDLLRIIHSYFPELIKELKEVDDPRYKNYSTFDICVLLMERILSAIFSHNSMQTQTFAFNDENMIKNVAIMLKIDLLKELPHHDTINNCLEKLKPEELEKIIKKMINALIRRNTFKDSRVRGKYWQVLVDGTTICHYPHKHCEHCLFRRYKNRKGKVTKVEFYHYVLEAKLVLHENLVFSMGTEFVDNEEPIPDEEELYSSEYDEESYDKKKQDCEINAFYRLANKLKTAFPQLPICITADGLYPCKPVFEICRDNKWHFILRFKEGCIPTLYDSYRSLHIIKLKEQSFHKIVDNVRHDYFYASGLTYEGFNINFAECEVAGEEYPFLFITDLPVSADNCEDTVMYGRRRWRIENEGFKVQKQHGFYLKHMFSKNYNAMKNHYFLIQIAHAISQLLEHGTDTIEKAKLTKAQFHVKLFESFQKSVFSIMDLLAAEEPAAIRLKY